MSASPIIRPQVYWDLDEIAAYIQKDNPQAALRFLDSADATFASLAQMPGIGSRYLVRHPRLKDLRCFPVKDFPNHLIFYQPADDDTEIIRVLHGARNLAAILRRER
jgi:toxin ParE1/3/4